MKFDNTGPISPEKITLIEIFSVFFFISATMIWISSGSTWWWSSDDSQILKHAITHNIWQFFLSPHAWRELSASNLTPWLSISYKADLFLFGLSPWFFHMHQLISICIALVLFYMVSRIWLIPLASFSSTILLLFSRPLLEAMGILMVRHYIEGLIFSLAAILCFIKALKTNRHSWHFTCVFLYLLACISKEIYVPLPAILMAFPIKDMSSRFKKLLPLFTISAIYLPWRLWMLGASGKAYGKEFSLSDGLKLPSKALQISGYDNELLIFFFILAALIIFFISNRANKISLIVIVACIFLPILPVSTMMSPRYALLPAILTALCAGWWFQRCIKYKKAYVTKALIISFLAIAFLQLWMSNIVNWKTSFDQNLQRIKIEGEFVLNKGGPKDFLYKPADAPWFYGGLAWLRTNILGKTSGPRTFYDPVFLVNQSGYRIMTYNSDTRAILEDNEFTEKYKRYFPKVNFNAPLYARLKYSEPLAEWELGPWEKGEYAFLFDEYCQMVYPLPAKGMIPVQFKGGFAFRIRYISPEGWITYSPVLLLKIKKGQGNIHWKRIQKKDNGIL